MRFAARSLLLATAVVGASCKDRGPSPPATETPTSTATPSSAAAAGVECAGLPAVVLAHASVLEARVVPAAGPIPEHCRVLGASHPTADSDIRFELAVPAGTAWNGRYLQVGNGGFAGSLPEDDIAAGLAAGYATAGTDDGHVSQSSADTAWALGHPEKVVDFGYRALKETTDAARALLRAHTGRAAARSYFSGCSDGGREALVEAQRYPTDFDGIVAGSPANHASRVLFAMAWNARALQASPGSYLPPAALALVEAAAQKACGAVDGVIDDPLSCRFDPATLRCHGAATAKCLTDAQVTALRAIYDGPRNPRTGARVAFGFEPGAEAEPGSWGPWIVGSAPGPEGHAAQLELALGFFRSMVFGDPGFELARLNFDADVATVDARLAPILDSNDPDLGAFQRGGGKLLQVHGWADPVIAPRESIAYYERVRAAIGDPTDFYRLFMVPGMLHCGGGQGPSVVPALETIAAWVEQGRAPDRIVAAHLAGGGARAEVDRTRPLCPYPLAARWDGAGDRRRAESFACAMPPSAARDR